MTSKETVGDKLVALNALREDLGSATAGDQLRKGLDDRSNRIVERAADLIAETEDKTFVDDLLRAYRRMQIDAVKTDPGCLAKTAILRTLVRFDLTDLDVYREGIEYQQHEPIWGGEKDTAAELRCVSAIGLASCAEVLEVLNRCAVLLGDPCFEARAGAARALGALSQPEGAPLLRLKLLVGDAVPEVIAECSSALLKLDRETGLPFVAKFLSSESANVCVQVGLALGESRLAEAFGPLREAWERSTDRSVRESLLLCIGLLRSTTASDFLLSLIDRRDLGSAANSVKALKVCRGASDLKERVAKAVEEIGDAKLKRIFQEEWRDER